MITNKFLDNLKNKGITPGLERIKKMSSQLSNPQNDFKSIHIAGTNGKGSVCNIIYRILKNSGYKTGLYTSPELYELNERIVINDKNIQDDYIINFINISFILKQAFCRTPPFLLFNFDKWYRRR